MNPSPSPPATRVLIVEDERLVAMDLQLMLQELGYEVLDIVGEGGAAVVAAHDLPVDLILMDIHLRGAIDGVAAAAAIRQDCDVPIIFLTAHADPATRARVRTVAPYGYLVKPFDEQVLEVTLEMALARHAAELRTRTSERWLSTLLDSLADAVIAVDTAGRVIMLNAAAEQLLGVSAASSLGRPAEAVAELLQPDGAAPLDPPLLQALRQASGVEVPPGALLRQPDGGGRPVDASAAPICAAGQTLGAVMVFRDSTPRRLAEQARAVELRRAEEVRQRERLKVLAGGIAHDLNNMLTSVVGNIDLALLDLPPAHPAYELLAQAHAGGRRAAELTRQLLVYAGRARPQSATLGLGALVGETVELLRSTVLHDVRVGLALAGTPLMVNADAAQLRQVVMNLVINAAEALAAGGSVQIRLSDIDTSAGPVVGAEVPPQLAPGRYALLTVTDSGHGMDQATQDHIFDPFFTTKFTGRGLGLALVQGIVHDHGGAVGVHSVIGQGTTFAVWLPALRAREGAPEPTACRGGWQGAGTALLIDDEEGLRAVTGQMLARCGFGTLSAASGEEGLAIFRARRAEIACVVLDVTMPGMPGTEVAQELRRAAPALPIVLMSGYTAEDAVTGLAEALQIVFLPKPFLLDDLRAALQRAIAAPRAEQLWR